MKRFFLLALLVFFSSPVFSTVLNPFLGQIRDVYEGKPGFGAERKNSILKTFSFGQSLPSQVIVVGKGDPSALLKYGAKVQTRAGKYFTAFVPVSSLTAIENETAVDFLNYEPPLQKYLDVANPYVDANQSYAAGYKGDDVIVGVVDTGIDVNHLDFKTENGLSRIISVWDQTVNGKSPYGFDYGWEWTKYDIDSGICTEFDDQFHGTHVTGIAAGNGYRSGGLYKGISPRANIVFVKMNFNSMGYLLDAVSYIFNMAKTMNRPCVINLSLGNQAGSHTEYDDFNQAMDAVVEYYGRNGHIIVWAAGNDGNQKIHVLTSAIAGDATVSNIYSTSQMSLFFWYTNSSLSVRIRNQAGATIVNYTNTSAFSSFTTGTVDLQTGANGAGEKYLYVNIHGTFGTWCVDFKQDPAAGKIDGYVVNNGQYVHNSFDNDTPAGSLSGQAGQKFALSVGAMVTKTSYQDILGGTQSSSETIDNIATFSSRGPTRDGKNKPEVAAPGSFIVSVLANTPGFDVLSIYKINQYYFVEQGTSMAAPMVTGIIAQMLEKETNLSVADIQQKFMNYTKLNAFKTSRVWDNAFGYGIADLAFLTTVNAAQARLDITFKNNVMNVSKDKDNLFYILLRSNSALIGKTVRTALYDKNGGLIADFGKIIVDQIAVKEYVWNGKDQFGRTVRPGLYFVQVTVDNDNSRYPVLVVR